jgi:predicted amino acid racemase
MYLDTTAKRNPALIRAATMLHQSGVIPANTYVIDLDAVRHNAEAMAQEAERVGISLYFMSKHFNRNPLVSHTVVAAGIPSAVAVDLQGAQYLHRYGVPVGHVGHLVQIPRHSLRVVLEMRPEVMTIFSVDKARQVSEVALQMGLVQDILIRVRAENDIIYPNEEGGIWEADLEVAAKEMARLGGINIAGVVTFPATLYNAQTRRLEATPNFATLRRAAERLSQLGFEIKQINAPGASSTLGFDTVARNGGTHAEPGHALTGTTPSVLYDDAAPERSAMIYVNEVSHLFEGKAYVFGGGFYGCDTPANRGDDSAYHTKPWTPMAFVGRAPEDIMGTKVPVDIGSFFGRTLNATDYYGGTLCPEDYVDIRVGDTVIYGFRAQVFTTRSQVAVIDGVESDPRLLGLFDRANNLLDEKGYPVEDSKARVHDLVASLVDSAHVYETTL